MNTKLFVSLAVLLFASQVSAQKRVELGHFQTNDPAFVQLFPTGPGEPDALWITSFSGFRSGHVHYVEDIAGQISSKGVADVKIQEVDGSFEWPNLISYIPQGTIKNVGEQNPIAIVPDGFLVPGKQTGGLYVLLKEESISGITVKKGLSLVAKKKGWFYHMVYWRDVNKDGLLDILTARAHSNLGQWHGELVYLEQPSSNPLSGPWKEQVLTKGPDVLFDILETGENVFNLYAAQFFTNSLSIYEITEGSDVKVTNQGVIDTDVGPYDIHVIDLDLNRKFELLTTNHQEKAGGNVTAFTIPSDPFDTEAYQKIPLASGFNVTEPGANQMAPGFVTPFNFLPSQVGVFPPSLFVAGDGSQRAYQMDFVSSFKYNTEEFLKVDGVVGIVATDYIGKNGEAEFFVPDYDENKIYAYTYE